MKEHFRPRSTYGTINIAYLSLNTIKNSRTKRMEFSTNWLPLATDKKRILSITKFNSIFSYTRKPKSDERNRACVNSLTWTY